MFVPKPGMEPMRRRDLAAVMGERALRKALKAGVLIQPWRGVIMHGADALNLCIRCKATSLLFDDDAVISAPTALALHGCLTEDCLDVHMTVPYERRYDSRPGLPVHQNVVAPHEVTKIGTLRVLGLDTALADYLCDGPGRTAFATLDRAMYGLTDDDREGLRAQVRTSLRQRDDPRGVANALMLTELATGKADSPPESWIRLMVVAEGFPIPQAQYKIRSVDGRVIYVLDSAWPELRIALEYDGFAAHEGRGEYDAERDRRLKGYGWIVIRVTAEDLRDPSRVFAELRAAFAQRSR